MFFARQEEARRREAERARARAAAEARDASAERKREAERIDREEAKREKLNPEQRARTLRQYNQIATFFGNEPEWRRPGEKDDKPAIERAQQFLKSQGLTNRMPGVSKPTPEELRGRGEGYTTPPPGKRMAGKRSESGGKSTAALKTYTDSMNRPQSAPKQVRISPMENWEESVSSEPTPLEAFSEPLNIRAKEPRGFPVSRKLMEARLRNEALRMERQTEKMSKDRRAVHERFNTSPEGIQNISGQYDVTHGPIPQQKQLRALGDMAFQLHDLAPYMQRVAPFADRDALQYEAQRLRGEMSPFSDAERDKQQLLMDVLNEHASSNKSLEASNPYLERMSRSPAESHEALFGEMEREALDDLYKRGTREFQEKILPKIMNNYQTPGLRRHGQQAKDIAGAGEKFARGLQEEGTKSKIALRDMLLKHGGQHGILQAHGAGIAGKAAEKGEQNRLNALKMIDAAKNAENVRKTAHIGDLSNEGAANREEEQKLLNFEEQQNRAIYDKPYQDVQRTAEILKGIPVTSKTTAQNAPNLGLPQDNSRSNLYEAGSNAIMGLSRDMRPKKQGGRVQKAIGGQVNPMQNVIQNAVIDKIDPVTELRRMLQHTQGIQGLQARQQLKIGGMVDPIKAGAADANMYAGHNAMKDKLHRLRNPEKQHPFNSAMDSMAAASKESPGWLGKAMRAYGFAGERLDNIDKENRTNLNEADKLEYQLQQKLEEKAMKEREAAQKDRDLARQDQLAASTIEHHRMMNQKLGHEIAAPKKPKLESHDRKILESAGNTLKTADPFISKLDRLDELTGKIHTGGVTSDMPILGSPRVQSIFSGKQADYDEFDKIVNGIVTDATAAFGARGGARIAAIIEKGKPNRGMSAEGLKAIIAQMRDAVKEEEALAGSIYDQYEEGVAPTTALRNYTSQRTAKRDTPKGSSNFSVLTPEEENNLSKPELEQYLANLEASKKRG